MRKYIIPIVLLFLFNGCSSFNFVDSINKVKFDLVEISSITFCDVNFKDKSKLKDFNFVEIAKITASVASGKFPGKIEFAVKAQNHGNNPDAFSFASVKIKSFPYKMYLYDKEVITGNIKNPINFPAPGESVNFELTAGFDLFGVLKDVGYQKLVNTVLAIKDGDFNSISAKLTSRPVLDLPWGEYEFPDDIKLENKID